MSSSLALWIGAALLLFWSVGAYNRLVRLRSDANAAFGSLESELGKQIALVHSCLPQAEGQAAAWLDGQSSFWGGLQGAAAQLAASMAAARSKPLEPEGIAALRSAHAVLAMAWQRVEREESHDLAGPRLPDTVTMRRAQLAGQVQAAIDQFNLAVSAYNAAIGQFPALLVSWLFGFRPGLPL